MQKMSHNGASRAFDGVHPVILGCIHPMLMDFHGIKLKYVFYDLEYMYLPT